MKVLSLQMCGCTVDLLVLWRVRYPESNELLLLYILFSSHKIFIAKFVVGAGIMNLRGYEPIHESEMAWQNEGLDLVMNFPVSPLGLMG